LRKEIAEGLEADRGRSLSPRTPFKKVNHLKSIEQSLEKIQASRKQKLEMRKLDRKTFEHKMTNMKQELHEKLLAKGKAKPTMVAYDFWDNRLQAKVGKIYSETINAQGASLDVFVRLEEIYGLIESEKQAAEGKKLAASPAPSDGTPQKQATLLSPNKIQIAKVSETPLSKSLPKISLPVNPKSAPRVESSSKSNLHSRANSQARPPEELLPVIKESEHRRSSSNNSSSLVNNRSEATERKSRAYLLQVLSHKESPLPSSRKASVSGTPALLDPPKGNSALFSEVSNLNSKRQSALRASVAGKELSPENTDLKEKKKSLQIGFDSSRSELTGLAENHKKGDSQGQTDLTSLSVKRLSVRHSRKSAAMYEKPQTPKKKDILDNPFGFLSKYGAESLNASLFNESASLVRGKGSLVEESQLISREKGEGEVQGFIRASKWIVETCNLAAARPAMRNRLDLLREGIEAYNRRDNLDVRRRAGTKEDAYNIEYLKAIFERKRRAQESGSFNS
jgi:hypothetical protein